MPNICSVAADTGEEYFLEPQVLIINSFRLALALCIRSIFDPSISLPRYLFGDGGVQMPDGPMNIEKQSWNIGRTGSNAVFCLANLGQSLDGNECLKVTIIQSLAGLLPNHFDSLELSLSEELAALKYDPSVAYLLDLLENEAALSNKMGGHAVMELPLFATKHELFVDPLDNFDVHSTTGTISDPCWSFWREWYQGFLDGKPLDWELQRRVALIDDDIWEAGPEAVAEEIERIRAAYLAEKAPQAERIEFDHDAAKFRAVPIEVAKPDLLGATLSQVEDALDDVMASPSNGLHDRAREVRVLRRVFTKYGNDPQQIEMGFVSVHKGLTRQILNDELPASEENLALQDALEDGARAIRATHPEVAENRKILSEQAIRELPGGAKEQLEEALPMLKAISDDDLAEDWGHDIPQLINDATLPLPSGAPPLPGADEATRIFSRVAKIGILMRVVSVVRAIDDKAVYKATAITLVIRELVKLGLAIL